MALNSSTWPPGCPGAHRGGVGGVRREVADRVVAPVVGQPALEQELVRHVLVHRQKLDGRDTEVGQIGPNGVVCQPRVGSTQFLGDARVPHGEALDVDLVDHRVREVPPERGVRAPVEGRVRDQAERHVPGGVERAGRVVVVPGVVEHLRAERDLAAHRPRVRVEQQLGRVAAQPAGGVVRPAHAEPVGLRLAADPGDEPVPGAAVVVRQPEPGLVAGLVEQADLGRLGHAGATAKLIPPSRGVAPRGDGRPGSASSTRPTLPSPAGQRLTWTGRRGKLGVLCRIVPLIAGRERIVRTQDLVRRHQPPAPVPDVGRSP